MIQLIEKRMQQNIMEQLNKSIAIKQAKPDIITTQMYDTQKEIIKLFQQLMNVMFQI